MPNQNCRRYEITKRYCWPNATFTYVRVMMTLDDEQLKFFDRPEYIVKETQNEFD